MSLNSVLAILICVAVVGILILFDHRRNRAFRSYTEQRLYNLGAKVDEITHRHLPPATDAEGIQARARTQVAISNDIQELLRRYNRF